MLRILAIDGGGVRGVIPATWLAALEETTGRRTAELFDLVVGTSTGGLIALGLTCPDPRGGTRSAADIRDQYFDSVERIFPAEQRQAEHRMAPGEPRYDAGPLRHYLQDLLGETRLSQAVCPVAVVACDVAHTQPLLLTGGGLDQGLLGDVPMVTAALATSALPTYFPPVQYAGPDGRPRLLVDGGLAADDPALAAYGLGCSLTEDPRGGKTDVLLVSVGTGTSAGKPHVDLFANVGPSPEREVLKALGPDIAMVLGGPSELMRQSLSAVLGARYVRVQARLEAGANHAADDSSPGNLKALLATAEAMISADTARLEELSGLLQENRAA